MQSSGAVERHDVVVVGAGAAGLYAALRAAGEGAGVALVSATPLAQTASYWAQGGLAAALAADDSPELHLADTEAAGRGLVRRSAAEVLVRRPRTGCATCKGSACASTPTGTASSRWASRAAIRFGASSTPEAAPRAVASSASCRRSLPRARGYDSRGRPCPVAVGNEEVARGCC